MSIRVLDSKYWQDMATHLALGGSTDQVATSLGVPIEVVNNTLSHPDFRKLLLQTYEETSSVSFETRKHFERHALKACQAITDILNDPDASPSLKLKAASLILKGMGAEHFKPSPLISVKNTTEDNRSITIEQILSSIEEESPNTNQLPESNDLRSECLSRSFDLSLILPSKSMEVKSYERRKVDSESSREDET